MAGKRKTRAGVLFGGRSGEHEISLRSALTVMSGMDPGKYEIVPIGIGRDGRWYLPSDAIAMLKEATPKLRALGRGGTPVSLLPHPEGRALVTTPARNGRAPVASGKRKPSLPGPLDVVFPVLHGTYGEDGTVQGLLELAGIRQTQRARLVDRNQPGQGSCGTRLRARRRFSVRPQGPGRGRVRGAGT